MGFFIDILDGGPGPKRGDLVETNVGDKRQRTWFVLRARRIRRKDRSAPARYEVEMARWWELEVEMRLRLYRSAERNGGQRVIHFTRYRRKPKRRMTFDDYMRQRSWF